MSAMKGILVRLALLVGIAITTLPLRPTIIRRAAHCYKKNTNSENPSGLQSMSSLNNLR